MRDGNFGQTRSIDRSLSELKVDYGPGFRVYFTRQGNVVVVLLCGGDESTQERDIERAKRLFIELETKDGA